MIRQSLVRNTKSVFILFHSGIILVHHGIWTWSRCCFRGVRSTSHGHCHDSCTTEDRPVIQREEEIRKGLCDGFASAQVRCAALTVTEPQEWPLTLLLWRRLTAEMCCILRLSAPLKLQYAQVQYTLKWAFRQSIFKNPHKKVCMCFMFNIIFDQGWVGCF